MLEARLRELHVGLASAQCDARGLRSVNRGRHASRHTLITRMFIINIDCS